MFARTIKGCLLLTNFALLGCASHQFAIAEYEPAEQPIYPAIDVFSLRPSESFQTECEDFDRKSLLNHCSLNHIDYQSVSDQLARSGLFESVALASRETPYSIALSSAAYDTESAGELGQAALAGATLLLVPVTNHAMLKIEALISWNNVPLEMLSYELPFTVQGSWTTTRDDVGAGLTQSVASHILRDLESKEVFSSARLHEALQSSNYERDLSMPIQLGRFTKSSLTTLRNPLYGAQVRYAHTLYDGGHVDVFVYPIGTAEYANSQQLWLELKALHTDMELMAKEGHLSDFAIDEIERSTLANNAALGAFNSSYSLGDGQLLASRTVLFAVQDKFVKVRATFGAYVPVTADVEVFVRELAKRITVPDESTFMAQLRKTWRSHTDA